MIMAERKYYDVGYVEWLEEQVKRTDTQLSQTFTLLKMAEKALSDYMKAPNSMMGNRAIRYFNEKEELLNK